MIDCHSHFYNPQFTAQQIAEQAAKARAVGVQAIVVVPEDLQDCRQVLPAATPPFKGCCCLEPADLMQMSVRLCRCCSCQWSSP